MSYRRWFFVFLITLSVVVPFVRRDFVAAQQDGTVPGQTVPTGASAARALYMPLIVKGSLQSNPPPTPVPGFTEEMFIQKSKAQMARMGVSLGQVRIFLSEHTPAQKEMILKCLVKSWDLTAGAYNFFRFTDPDAPTPFRQSVPILTLLSNKDMRGGSVTYIYNDQHVLTEIVIQLGTLITMGELQHTCPNEAWPVVADTTPFADRDPVLERPFSEGLSNIISRYVLRHSSEGQDNESKFVPEVAATELADLIIESEWGQSVPLGEEDSNPDQQKRLNDKQAAIILALLQPSAKMYMLVEHVGSTWSKKALELYGAAHPGDDKVILSEAMAYISWQNSNHGYTPTGVNEWISTQNDLMRAKSIPPVQSKISNLLLDYPYVLAAMNSRFSAPIDSGGQKIYGRMLEATAFFSSTAQAEVTVKFFPDQHIVEQGYKLPRNILFTRPDGSTIDISKESGEIRYPLHPLQTILTIHVADAATNGRSGDGSTYLFGVNFDWRGNGNETTRYIERTLRVNVSTAATAAGTSTEEPFPVTELRQIHTDGTTSMTEQQLLELLNK